MSEDTPRVRSLPRGAFNAKSPTWGSPRRDNRGGVIENWAAGFDLCLVNTGTASTCVRPQRESIGSHLGHPFGLALNWQLGLVVDGESLSDHRYIQMAATPTPRDVLARRRIAKGRTQRWALKKLDEDVLYSSILAALWERENREEGNACLEDIGWIMEVIIGACNASMPRIRPSSRKAVYWWTEEIAELRRSSVHARRALDRTLRSRNRARMAARIGELEEAYRTSRLAIRTAIRKEKARTWDELILTLDEDPWGRPYKIVLNKMRRGAAPVTETLDPRFIQKVVTTLFPDGEGMSRISPLECLPEWEDELGVSQGELRDAVRRIKSGKDLVLTVSMAGSGSWRSKNWLSTWRTSSPCASREVASL